LGFKVNTNNSFLFMQYINKLGLSFRNLNLFKI
jgi:hypothetical protein